MPLIEINFVALAAAVAASFIFGWLWYGPLFGKTCARLTGMPSEAKPDPGAIARGMALTLLGTVLTAYVLAHSTNVWRPSAWNAGADAPDFVYGFFSGLFTWLGFYVPMLLGTVAWENRGWKLFGLNAAYHFANLQLVAMILAHWR